MSEAAYTSTIEYAEDPVYFKQLFDSMGQETLADMLGYSTNHIRMMYDGRRQVRKFVEFACEQYIENNSKQENKEKIFFFTASKDSPEYIAISSVASALGVTISAL